MTRARSTAYPVLDLSTAYKILRQDLTGLRGGELERDDLARKLGYQAGPGGLAARKIGALVHYGLVDRRGGYYGLSPLGLRLQDLDLDDREFLSAVRAALEQPSLFRGLLNHFRGIGRIPTDLRKELTSFGITEQAHAHAAQVFRSSALFARVIATDGAFCDYLPKDDDSATSTVVSLAPEPEEQGERWHQVQLMLANGKFAWLRIPLPMTPQDHAILLKSFQQTHQQLPEHLGFKELQETTQENDPNSRRQQTTSNILRHLRDK